MLQNKKNPQRILKNFSRISYQTVEDEKKKNLKKSECIHIRMSENKKKKNESFPEDYKGSLKSGK